MRLDSTDPRALTSLAVLRVNWDEASHDYLEDFVPFLLEALRAGEDLVALPELNHYGLSVC